MKKIEIFSRHCEFSKFSENRERINGFSKEACYKNLKKTLPCAAYLNGEYGFKNIYAGVPVIIGSNGIEKVIELPLNQDEKKNFFQKTFGYNKKS